MNTDKLNESKLAEILQMAQQGETKFKEMSDSATIIAEKWRVKISNQLKQKSKSD